MNNPIIKSVRLRSNSIESGSGMSDNPKLIHLNQKLIDFENLSNEVSWAFFSYDKK